MYNNTGKNYNVLDEQLAVSGIENNIFGIFSGVASIAGGIFGASQASSSNAAARKAQKKQEKAAEKAAEATNEYNEKVFEADKKNYYNIRKYEYDTAIRNWKYNQSIQDYQYLQTVRQYGQSVENTGAQLGYNQIAAEVAYNAEMGQLDELLLSSQLASSSEIAILKEQAEATDIQSRNELGQLQDQYTEGALNINNELGALVEQAYIRKQQASNQQGLFNQSLDEDAFKRQAQGIDTLQKQGRVQTGQAGRSRTKGLQATLAEQGRNEALLANALTNTAAQTQRNLTEIDTNYMQARNSAKRNINAVTVGLSNATNQVQRNLADIQFNYKSASAQTGRNIKEIQLSFQSAVGQAGRNIRDITTQRYGADMRAMSSMMLRPERLPDLLTPTQAPERIFVEPLEATPAYIPPARQQSVFTPLISGLTSAAGAFGQSQMFNPITPQIPR